MWLNKQQQAAERERVKGLRAQREAAASMTIEERETAQRLRLYAIHKAHCSLEIYYQLYPDYRPKGHQKSEHILKDERSR